MVKRPSGTKENSGMACGAHAPSDHGCLPREALPPDPRGVPLFASSMVAKTRGPPCALTSAAWIKGRDILLLSCHCPKAKTPRGLGIESPRVRRYSATPVPFGAKSNKASPNPLPPTKNSS
jgi:hypothetical protein